MHVRFKSTPHLLGSILSLLTNVPFVLPRSMMYGTILFTAFPLVLSEIRRYCSAEKQNAAHVSLASREHARMQNTWQSERTGVLLRDGRVRHEDVAHLTYSMQCDLMREYGIKMQV
jgi:hypothetical protein